MAITDNLISTFPLDESGADGVGPNDLTQAGTFAYVEGKLGHALRLTGVTDQGLSITNAALTGLDPADGPWSVEFGVRLNGTTTGLIVLKAAGATGILILAQNVGGSNVVIGGGALINGAGSQVATGVVSTGQWYHVVMTYDPEDGAALYLNGSLVDSDSTTVGSLENGGRFGIGSPGAPTPSVDGDVDFVRAWVGRAITAQEVSDLYNSGAWLTDEDLLGPPPDTTAPSVPEDLAVTHQTHNSLSLSWSASTDDVGVAGYRIYRDDALSDSTSGTTYTDAGLDPETEYDYQVSAYDAAENESDRTSIVTGETTAAPTTTPLAVIGDSDSDEYRADDDRGQDPHKPYTLNWTEILVNTRGLDLGDWGTWGGPRRSGYEYNWARSGATLSGIGSQVSGIVSQIENEDLAHVVINVGINDWKIANGLPGQIYSGTLSGTALDDLIDEHAGYIESAVADLVTAGAEGIAICHIPDEMLMPPSWDTFSNATFRQRVHTALETLNGRFDALESTYEGVVVTVPFNEYLQELLLEIDGSGNMTIGGETVEVWEAGWDPLHMRLADSAGHASTISNCLKANFLIEHALADWGIVTQQFSEPEIIDIATGTWSGVPVVVEASGIASAEAFGSAVISVGAVELAPDGIASSEAFGSVSLGAGVAGVTPGGIPSAEAFGDASIEPGAVALTPDGIASSEAFGSASVGAGATGIQPGSIPSAEAFGEATIEPGAVVLVPDGIASAEAFGDSTVSTGFVLRPSAIASAEAFGASTATPGPVAIGPSGIVSAERFGSAAIGAGGIVIQPVGIGSDEAFGSPDLALWIHPTGIVTAEGFGTVGLVLGAITIRPGGIVSLEAFGNASVDGGLVPARMDVSASVPIRITASSLVPVRLVSSARAVIE